MILYFASFNATRNPSRLPTEQPTQDPTIDPTRAPSFDPTVNPTRDPSVGPTSNPTSNPSSSPTRIPTVENAFDYFIELHMQLSLRAAEGSQLVNTLNFTDFLSFAMSKAFNADASLEFNSVWVLITKVDGLNVETWTDYGSVVDSTGHAMPVTSIVKCSSSASKTNSRTTCSQILQSDLAK